MSDDPGQTHYHGDGCDPPHEMVDPTPMTDEEWEPFAQATGIEPLFASDRHAMYVGWVWGIAQQNGVPLQPVLDDDGNYTDRLALKWANAGQTIVVVVPPPPDDWVAP